MRNTVFIFGAGASYDSLYSDSAHLSRGQVFDPSKVSNARPIDRDWRPPLASQILETRDSFLKAGNYPSLRGLRGEFLAAMGNNDNFEKFIAETLRDPVINLRKNSKHRLLQYIEFTFYLQNILTGCSNKYITDANNYSILTNKLLDRLNDKEITFVTFNYDTLIEQALIPTNDKLLTDEAGLNTYLHGQIPLIKLHGSVDWNYEIEKVPSQGETDIEWLIERFSIIGSLKSEDIQFLPRPRESNHRIYFPALAVPVTNKAEFVCPKPHVAYLEKALSEADYLVTVGWRGTEDHFGALLKKIYQTKRPPVLISVNGSFESAKAVYDQIKENYFVPHDFIPMTGGFSEFVKSGLVTLFSQIDV